MANMREILDIINEMSEDESPVELQDSFDIELGEDLLIESGVIEILEDGILIQGDEKALELLKEHGVILEETDWSKYDEPTVSRIAKGKTKPVDKTDYNKPAYLRKKEKEEKKPEQIDEKMIMGLPGDQGSKVMGERKESTHEDPLVTVHDKHGLNTHALLSTVNNIFNINVDAEEVHKGPVTVKSGWDNERVLKIEISKHHKVDEGMTKHAMMDDAEKMSLEEFCDKYGDEDWVKEFYHTAVGDLDEAKYQGRTVPLGKPMAGDVKKSKVYVKGPKGNVVKVNFGDKKMKIKKSNPKRRKSFRARHNCANPGPRWKARYWSCRAW